jgi:hypothetical protein
LNQDRQAVHWPSVVQFTLSILAVFNLWIGALILGMMGFANLMAGASAFREPLPLFMLAATAGMCGLLIAPSAGYALWRILGKQAVDLWPYWERLRPGLWILAYPLVLLLGYGVSQLESLSWLLLPPLHILAICLPVFWLIYLSVRKLQLGSPQRRWGVLASGLALAPLLIVIVEGAALLALIVAAALAISSQPRMVAELSSLVDWLSNANPEPELIMQRIAPLLLRPSVILSVLVFGSVIVPLVEEAFKPIGVWLLVGRQLSPAEGFAAGALSGAGYALFESLALTSNSAEWAALVFARLGTGVVHIFTTGVVGWALAMAWGRRRYALLGAVYLGAVLVHGLWNAFTLSFSIASLGEIEGLKLEVPRLLRLGQAAPFVLASLAVVLLFALLAVNRALAEKPPSPALLPAEQSEAEGEHPAAVEVEQGKDGEEPPAQDEASSTA